ncbi:MAG: hypothetical protein U0359_05590 [Byssovorax sp.]
MIALRPALIGLALLGAGCEPATSPLVLNNDAGASPNASILPAPLATEPAPELLDAGAPPFRAPVPAPGDPSGRPDAGPPPPPPAPLTNEPLSPDALGGREVAGVSLSAVFRWRDLPPPHRAPEVSAEGLREAQRLTALGWTVDLAEAGRMRIAFTSHAMFLPARAEIRARSDRLGNVVVWPNGALYRVIPPGALRTLFGERRVDVTPLAITAPRPQGEGRRLGVATRKAEIVSSLGSLKLEIGRVPEAGEGGPLLCRALVELVGIDPKVQVCQAGEVPLGAAFAWQEGGGIGFEVLSVTKQADLGASAMLDPPPSAAYTPAGLPTVPNDIFLGREELAGLRTSAIPLPAPSDPTAPGEGFVAVNHTDVLTYVLLDGIPVVAVPAGSERFVIGPPRGRYSMQFRTFLGETVTTPITVELPARIHHGALPDAGAPDGASP